MTGPEPKATLLASLGIQPSALPSTPRDVEPDRVANAARAQAAPPTAPAPQPLRKRATVGESVPKVAPNTAQPTEIAAALSLVKAANRARRGSTETTPLAPFNVDVPLDLLREVRAVSRDVPYPLRRLAEEALQLWLIAAGYSINGTEDRVP